LETLIMISYPLKACTRYDMTRNLKSKDPVLSIYNL